MTDEEKRLRRAERRKARKEAEKSKKSTRIAVVREEEEEPVKKRKKKVEAPKSDGRYENGEYVPEPKNLSALKKYVTTYFRAVKWKNRDNDFNFPGTPIHISGFKVEKNKEIKSVDISFTAKIITDKVSLEKPIQKKYTLDNHKQVRTDIINVFREAKRNDFIKENSVDVKKLVRRGWTKTQNSNS